MSGDTFVVSFADASVLIHCTRIGEELIGMATSKRYEGTLGVAANAVAATTASLDGKPSFDVNKGVTEEESVVHGATGSSSGVKGTILSGHKNGYIRFLDAHSGQCTYNMLSHSSAVSAVSLSHNRRELVSAGHDGTHRFWSLEKRSWTQEISSSCHMHGEGVCSVIWSQDGRWVVSGDGDCVVKVFAR